MIFKLKTPLKTIHMEQAKEELTENEQNLVAIDHLRKEIVKLKNAYNRAKLHNEHAGLSYTINLYPEKTILDNELSIDLLSSETMTIIKGMIERRKKAITDLINEMEFSGIEVL